MNELKEIAISLKKVGKRFKVYDDPILGPIRELALFWRKDGFYKDFWAVKDVSFEVKKGEVVGLIGPNGAGKTTLLKMIAGLLNVDEGEILIKGKVTALLVMGLGFNPEFTGRENIFYGGMLLGMGKSEILSKMDSIIDFAELREFIEQPFRTYSAGMKARLIFATSMAIDPEILIVDEALATGDAQFVQKCQRRIKELCKGGATIIFVSHNLIQVQTLCDRAVLLDRGRVTKIDNPSAVISKYNELLFSKERQRIQAIAAPGKLKMISGSGGVIVENVSVLDSKGKETEALYTHDFMEIKIHYQRLDPSIKEIDFFIGFICEDSNEFVGEISFSRQEARSLKLNDKGIIKIIIDDLILLTNSYTMWIFIYDSDTNQTACEYKNVKSLFVARRYNVGMKDAYFRQPCSVEVV
jgi:ABC-type polysaccharide/polyol phosphate transport system ATPase subunit